MTSPINNKTNQIKSLLHSCSEMMGEFKQRKVSADKTNQYLAEVNEQVGVLRDWMVENYQDAKKLSLGKVTSESLELNRELFHLDLRIINLSQILEKVKTRAPIQEIQASMNRRLDDHELLEYRFERTKFEKFIKLVGHEWGINAHFQLGKDMVPTQGADPALLLNYAAVLVSHFVNKKEIQRSPLRVKTAVFAGSDAYDETLTNWVGSKQKQRVFTPKDNITAGKCLLREFKHNGLITIPTGWKGHSVGVTIHRSLDGKCYLYYCNRGGEAFQNPSERALMGKQSPNSTDMVCWEIGDPQKLQPELFAKIAALPLDSIEGEAQNGRAKAFLEGKDGLFSILELKEVARIPKKPQKMGNCSWANTKGQIHAAAIAASYDEQVKTKGSGSRDECMKLAIQSGTAYFKEMERFGRRMSLDKLLIYHAAGASDLLSPRDHVRFLSLAWQKLKGKTESSIPEDGDMLDAISSYFQSCRYRVADITHQGLSPSEEKRLIKHLKSAGDGAFTFINDRFLISYHGKIFEEQVTDMNGTLKGFLSQTPLQRLQIKPLYFSNSVSTR